MPPSLFGIQHSNRDFTKTDGWSKNNFNSAFPTSLCCYMASQHIQPVYLIMDENGVLHHTKIDVTALFNHSPFSDSVYYAFESIYSPYQTLVIGDLPRIDLVIMDRTTGITKRGLEIKLTALPDNSTAHLSDAEYGCELVIRPDTIVYLALSVANLFKNNPEELENYLPIQGLKSINWSNPIQLLEILPVFIMLFKSLMSNYTSEQIPLIMQPIWKTQGKRLILDDNAFDIFVWSNFAVTQLFFYSFNANSKTINRQIRAIIWLMRMLYDFVTGGKIDYARIIDALSLSTKNDKAFSASGRITHRFMTCPELTNPRIKKDAIRHIILGDGQKLLSPERRLDAVIMSMSELFED
ncbi:MAG: HindVP family restriction endonuclease [Anaerolineae bacterium]|nr:HindVP family restriction endonuclease [Anaerolineae bacterium]